MSGFVCCSNHAVVHKLNHATPESLIDIKKDNFSEQQFNPFLEYHDRGNPGPRLNINNL